MKAKKFIEKKIEGEYEYIKNHVIDIDIDEQILSSVSYAFLGVGDDPELDCLEKGVITDSDGEISYIQIGKFLKAVDEKNFENTENDEDCLDSELYEKIQKLKPFHDYELYCV